MRAKPSEVVLTTLTGEKRHKELATTVPHLAGIVLLDGVGHYVQQERPKEVTAALLDFLRKQNLS